MPVAKVASYAYVNPMVAVVLGILFLHERPAVEEFAGMAAILVAVFLLTTARVKVRADEQPGGGAGSGRPGIIPCSRRGIFFDSGSISLVKVNYSLAP